MSLFYELELALDTQVYVSLEKEESSRRAKPRASHGGRRLGLERETVHRFDLVLRRAKRRNGGVPFRRELTKLWRLLSLFADVRVARAATRDAMKRKGGKQTRKVLFRSFGRRARKFALRFETCKRKGRTHLEEILDHAVLLDHGHTLELRRLDLDFVHCAAATRDIRHGRASVKSQLKLGLHQSLGALGRSRRSRREPRYRRGEYTASRTVRCLRRSRGARERRQTRRRSQHLRDGSAVCISKSIRPNPGAEYISPTSCQSMSRRRECFRSSLRFLLRRFSICIAYAEQKAVPGDDA